MLKGESAAGARISHQPADKLCCSLRFQPRRGALTKPRPAAWVNAHPSSTAAEP